MRVIPHVAEQAIKEGFSEVRKTPIPTTTFRQYEEMLEQNNSRLLKHHMTFYTIRSKYAGPDKKCELVTLKRKTQFSKS